MIKYDYEHLDTLNPNNMQSHEREEYERNKKRYTSPSGDKKKDLQLALREAARRLRL